MNSKIHAGTSLTLRNGEKLRYPAPWILSKSVIYLTLDHLPPCRNITSLIFISYVRYTQATLLCKDDLPFQSQLFTRSKSEIGHLRVMYLGEVLLQNSTETNKNYNSSLIINWITGALTPTAISFLPTRITLCCFSPVNLLLFKNLKNRNFTYLLNVIEYTTIQVTNSYKRGITPPFQRLIEYTI